MNKPISSLLFNCKIHNFYTPMYDDISGNKRKTNFSGTDKFEMMLGDHKIKWDFTTKMSCDEIQLFFKKEKSKFNDFNVRITCMIPRSGVDEEKPDRDNSMYIEREVCSAFAFDKFYRALCMKFDKFRNRYEAPELDIYIKVELFEGHFPKESKKRLDDHSLSSSFADLYQSGDFSDFTIICSDKREFRVHRNILSVNSPVLKAMMLTEMQESIENKLDVKDIDGSVMDQILLFMYTQKISNISDNIEGLLYGAEKYQLENLKTVCIRHMLDNIRVENAVDYFMLASLYDVEHLKQLCLMNIQIHYDELCNTEKWGQLNAEQLEFIEKAVKDYKASELTFEFENEDCFWQGFW